ncbi:MAG TPA: glutamate 5-kinase [Geobacteraceae bacterium]|nr:glutamate 5-kinase [Geobacteraceae bacterium]
MRRHTLKEIRRVVIKIGSQVLTSGDQDLDTSFVTDLAAQVATARKNGLEVLLVTSGAIAAGRGALGLTTRPKTIPQKQAAAAVGQSRLMRAYEDAFASHGINVAQLLLTRGDLADRTRYLNARATLETLLECGVVPIINENDTVAVEEIKFGDNDSLSALATNLVDANLLVILTDIDGLYDADPRKNPEAQLITVVKTVTKELERGAGGTGSTVGTGGMATKLAAAKKAGKSGAATVIANGTVDGIVSRVLAGEDVGTLILPAATSLTSRKHWIAFTLRPQGRVTVDAGASTVLRQEGKSLLPSGIVSVEGNFVRGACVRVCDPEGSEFARGITDYASDEINLILGRRSSEIEEILGFRYGDEIIHRDNMVLL